MELQNTGKDVTTMTREELENHVLIITSCLIDVMNQAGRSSNPNSTAMYRAKLGLNQLGIKYTN